MGDASALTQAGVWGREPEGGRKGTPGRLRGGEQREDSPERRRQVEPKRKPWRRPSSAGPWLCQWPALHRPGRWPGPGPAVFLSRAAAAASEKPHQDFPVRATPSSSSGRGSGGVSPKGFQFLSKKVEGPNPAVQSQVLRAGRSHFRGFPTSGPRVDLPKQESRPGFCRSFPEPPSFLPLRAHPLRPSLPPPTRGASAQNVACPPSGTRQVEIYFPANVLGALLPRGSAGRLNI